MTRSDFSECDFFNIKFELVFSAIYNNRWCLIRIICSKFSNLSSLHMKLTALIHTIMSVSNE